MTGEKLELNLYHYTQCPFCALVERNLENQGLRLPHKNILEDLNARKELVDIGGKPQVPCLVINGRPLYESADIVTWITDNAAKIKATYGVRDESDSKHQDENQFCLI